MSALTYVIFVLVAVIACMLGAVAAYFYYQAKHREAKAVLEALDQDVTEREEKLRSLKIQLASTQPSGDADTSELQAEVQRLKRALEQKQKDYDLLKHDFDLEIDLLKKEVEEIRSRRIQSGTSPGRVAEAEAELRRRGEKLREQAEALRERAVGLREREKIISERESALGERDAAVTGRESRIEAEIAERQKALEAAVAHREKDLKASIVEREKVLEEAVRVLEEERANIDRARYAIAEKEARVDAELMGLPKERFTREQEAILIKRLREQNRLQRDELETLHRQLDRAKRQPLSAIARTTRPDEPSAEDEMKRSAFANAAGDGATTNAAPSEIAGSHEKVAVTTDVEHTPESSMKSASRSPAELYDAPAEYVHETTTIDSSANSDALLWADDLEEASHQVQGDDLTELPGLDARVQAELYRLGITRFGQIAKWSSAEARLVAEKIGVDRKTIQDHWIVNAQSHLFAKDPSSS